MWQPTPPNGDWGRTTQWWRGGTSTSGTWSFPPILLEGENAAQTNFWRIPWAFDRHQAVFTTIVWADSDTAIGGKLGQDVSTENPNFVCWNTWHFPLSWWWNNQVFCGEHSHLICRNSIDFCSLPGEIWEDFVQVMLRALWRERFEIGSNLPTIILATECLLGFPAKFFPFHQDLMTTRFELSRSKLLQLWKQGMIENKLFFWISFLEVNIERNSRTITLYVIWAPGFKKGTKRINPEK